MGENNTILRPVTDTEFDSAGGTQVRSELKLARTFAPEAGYEARPETLPETVAARELNSGMANVARGLGMGGGN